MRAEQEETRRTMADYCRDKGITVTCEPIPARTDGSADDWDASAFHWRVTLHRGERTLITEYSRGSAHATLKRVPEWMPGEWVICHRNELRPTRAYGRGVRVWCKVTPTPPTVEDVLDSLRSDAATVQWCTFADWCRDLGYDTDSRTAERIYRACQDIATRLRVFLGVADVDAEFADVEAM